VVLLLGPLVACACRSSASDTGVQLVIITEDPTPLPSAIQVALWDKDKILYEWTVPESGSLSERQARRLTVALEVRREAVGERLLVVRGKQDERTVSSQAVAVTVRSGIFVSVDVVLKPGEVPDTDGDGLPDPIDPCPLSRDCRDAGRPPPDAGVDRAVDAAPPADMAVEGPTPDTSAVPDSSEDVTSADLSEGSDVRAEKPDAPPPMIGTGTGLRGDYYDGIAFDILRLSRVDPVIDLNLAATSPSPLLGNGDTFSIRWTGQVQPRYTDTYTFLAQCDDGCRLYVNNMTTPIIDRWMSNPGAVDLPSTPISLEAGRKYYIRFEFYENTAMARYHLRWSSEFEARAIIPAPQLYPAPPLPDGGTN